MPRHGIILKPAAVDDLDRCCKYDSSIVADAIEFHLTFEPTKESRSRIKRLRGLQPAQYRLAVGDFRVFYDVEESTVYVLRILSKEQTREFYREDES